MPKLRAAAVSFLNARPLTAGLEGSERIELVLAEPSRCAAMLEAGEVDLALVSVAALTKGEYEIVPGHRHRRRRPGADRGPRRRAVARDLGRGVPRHRLAHLARAREDRPRRRWASTRRSRRCTPTRGSPRAKGTKGALVIGDRGFDVRANHVLDLGREWTHLTGLPMIFALWAARPGRVSPEDVQELHARARSTGSGSAPSSRSASPRRRAATRSATAATSRSGSATGSGRTSSTGSRRSSSRPPRRASSRR